MEQRLSERVIGCAIEDSRELGHGFLERVYEAALAVELKRAGIAFQKQMLLPVQYRGESVGDYVCDFAVGDKLIVEIKALRALTSEHEAQVLNYLIGLLLNFGSPRLGVRRVVRGHDDAHPI